MARKLYSDQEREQVREALLNTVLQSIMERGLAFFNIEGIFKIGNVGSDLPERIFIKKHTDSFQGMKFA